FEVRHSDDDRFRIKSGGDPADALGEGADKKFLRIFLENSIGYRLDILATFQIRVIHQRHRMNSDVIVDDELEPRQADAVVRETRDGERVIGIADIHHHLCLRTLGVGDLVLPDLKIDLAVIDVSDIAFSTRHRDIGPALDLLGGVSGTDDAWNTKLAADDRAVTCPAAAFGDYRRRSFHDRLPRRIGHRRDEYLAFFEAR